MDPQLVQNLRYKLQKRVRRLNSASYGVFDSTVRQFWGFFDANLVYVAMADRLKAQFPNVGADVDRIFAGEGLTGETDDEAAALGYEVMRRIVNADMSRIHMIARGYGSASTHNEAIEIIRDIFLEPFYEYVDEHLDDQRAMLALLLRYKYRSEWFHRERLWTLTQTEPQRAEKLLALDLYTFLYDQGIDFSIEPSSLTGEVDLIGAQDSKDPLLADTKIFDGEVRGKNYLRKAFNQIYTYTQHHNEPFGYLVIFKTTDKDLRFSLTTLSDVPVLIYNHKTIFLLTIDIYAYPKPVSQRPPIRATEITEEELIATIEEEGRNVREQ